MSCTTQLSGDKAYELFMSDALRPLNAFLDAWRLGQEEGTASYVIAICGAYAGMLAMCKDGRYGGKIRHT